MFLADALSRDPFVKPVAQRLLSEPYSELLEQVCDVKDDGIQDAFRLTCQPQSLDNPPVTDAVDVSLTDDDVSSFLSSLSDWDCAPRQRALSFFCVYGFAQRIHSDQGANCESKLVAELLELRRV